MGDHTVAKFASIRPLVSNSVNTYMQHKHKEQMHYNDNIKQYSSGYSSNKENYKCSRTRSARLKKLKRAVVMSILRVVGNLKLAGTPEQE